MLLIIITMLYITSPLFLTETFYLLIFFTHFVHSSNPIPLAPINLFSIWVLVCSFFCFVFYITLVSEIIQYLSFFERLISLDIIPSRSVLLSQMVRFHSFYGWVVFLCVCVCVCIYIYVYICIYTVYLGYYK